MLRWYLNHGYPIAGWLVLAATLLAGLAYTRGHRRHAGPSPRRQRLWAAILLAEAGLHFAASAVWTDPDATLYGTNWRGLALLAGCAAALPLLGLGLSLRWAGVSRK